MDDAAVVGARQGCAKRSFSGLGVGRSAVVGAAEVVGVLVGAACGFGWASAAEKPAVVVGGAYDPVGLGRRPYHA